MDVFDLVAKITLDSSEYDEELDNAGNKAKSFGSALGGAITGGAKVLGAAAVTAIGATSAALVSGVSNVAAYGDNIDKMSQKMNMSAQAYQEWDAVMQHSGTSIETMKTSMKILANAVETGSDAFEKLGISQEEAANMSQEDLFAATITALQNVDSETERTYLASKLLGRGATELGALLNTSAEETQAMRDRVHELGGVMSDEAVKNAAHFQDNLQDMQTAISGVGRSITSDFLPGASAMMDGIARLLSGDSEGAGEQFSEGIPMITEAFTNTVTKVTDIMTTLVPAIVDILTSNLPALVGAALDILKAVGDGITQNLPSLMDAGVDIIMSLADFILGALPEFLIVSQQVLVSLVNGISEHLPELIPAAVEALGVLVDGFINNIDMIVDAAINLILAFTEGLINALPLLIEKAPEIIVSIVSALVDNLPKLIDAGIRIIKALIEGIANTIPVLVQKFPEMIEKIKEKFRKTNWKEIGQKVINWIKDGIQSLLTKIPEKLKEIAEKAGEWFKNIDWADVGKKVISFVLNGLKTVFFDIPNKLVEIGKEALESFKDIDWLDLGINIVTGIIDGLGSMGSALWDAVQSLASGIWDGILGFFGIESPSKKMEWAGEMIDEGLVKGINKGKNDVLEASDELVADTWGELDTSSVLSNRYASTNNNYAPSQNNNIAINVYGAAGQDVDELAEIISEKLDDQVYRRQAAWGMT